MTQETLIREIQKSLDNQLSKLNKLDLLDNISTDVNEMKKSIETISLIVDTNNMRITDLESKCTQQQQTINNLEKIIRKKNLFLTGISEGEQNALELENNIIKLFKDQLNLDVEEAHIALRLYSRG